MSEAMQKLDMGDAAAKLREKIQAAFVDMITPEQWSAMIESELRRFTAPTRVRDAYGNSHGERPSPLSAICGEILEKELRTRLSATLANPQAELVPGKTLEGVVVEWLDANRDTMLSSFLRTGLNAAMSQVMALAVAHLGADLPNPNNPGYAFSGKWIGR